MAPLQVMWKGADKGMPLSCSSKHETRRSSLRHRGHWRTTHLHRAQTRTSGQKSGNLPEGLVDPTTRIEPSRVTLTLVHAVRIEFNLDFMQSTPSRNILCELHEISFPSSPPKPQSPLRAPTTGTQPIPPTPPNVLLSGVPKGEDPLVLLR